MGLSILFPNGSVLAVQVYIDSTTGPIPWDGTVPIAPPVGGATAALQTVGNTSLASIDAKLTNPLPVSGTIAISTVGLALATLQSAGNSSLASIDGKLTNPLPVSGSVIATVTGNVNSTISNSLSVGTIVPVNSTITNPLTIGTIVGVNSTITNPLTIGTIVGVNSTVTGVVSVSNMIPAVETGLATSAKQDTIISDLAALLLTQGTTDTTAVGPLVQALVNDVPNSYNIDEIRPLSLTAEGRLRVSSVDSNIDKIWQHTFDNPWPTSEPVTEVEYV